MHGTCEPFEVPGGCGLQRPALRASAIPATAWKERCQGQRLQRGCAGSLAWPPLDFSFDLVPLPLRPGSRTTPTMPGLPPSMAPVHPSLPMSTCSTAPSPIDPRVRCRHLAGLGSSTWPWWDPTGVKSQLGS